MSISFLGQNGADMQKQEKKPEYLDFHIRVPIKLGRLFVDEANKERRKFSQQMIIILQERYKND